jgi:ABC-2 type transport system permease protein
MTTITAPEAPAASGVPRDRRPGLAATVRVEMAKLTSQWPLRIMLLVCVVAPIAFSLFTKSEWPAGPSDTLFGRWSGTTGFAESLTLLNSASIYGIPALAGLFAGDIFSGEDRHGTWKMLLTRSVSRTKIFLGKAIAAALCVWAGFLAVAIVSLIAGVLIDGGSSLVSLSGQLVPAGQAWGLVIAAWAYSLLPATAFVALGLLLSIASRSSIIGVLGPLGISAGLQVIEVLDSGQVARAISLATTFDSWHALFLAPGRPGTIAEGIIISLAWTVIFGGLALYLLRKRAFAASDATPRLQRRAAARIIGIAAVIGVILAVISQQGPTALTAANLQTSLAADYAHLSVVHYEWQTGTPGQINAPFTASCDRGSGSEQSQGAGDDWSCIVSDPRPADGVTPVTLDVTLKANGCYTASAGSDLGPLVLTNYQSREFINPMYEFDGCVGAP